MYVQALRVATSGTQGLGCFEIVQILLRGIRPQFYYYTLATYSSQILRTSQLNLHNFTMSRFVFLYSIDNDLCHGDHTFLLQCVPDELQPDG